MITIIVLWILLGIIAVIVILLHFSITAQIDLNKKGFDLKVRYMFFDIYPRKPKKKKQKRSKKAELPEDSFDDFEEFEDNIEESLPVPQTDDTPDKTGEVSEQIVEAKPENIAKNEADENDLYMSTLKLGQIDEDEYFGRVLYDELVDILKNIKTEHRKDKTTSDGAMVDNLMKELEDAQKLEGSADEKKIRTALKAIGINYDKLTEDEKS